MDDYGYLAARIRGMKGRLLPGDFFQGLLEQKELMKVADSLLSSPYGEDMSVALAGESGLLAVEKALRRNLYRVFRKVLQMCSEEPRRLLRVLLGKRDVYNIKTVLRGKQRGLPAPEGLFPPLPLLWLGHSLNILKRGTWPCWRRPWIGTISIGYYRKPRQRRRMRDL